MYHKLCSSRKYPCPLPPTEGIFLRPPPPPPTKQLWTLNFFWPLRPLPSPLEFSISSVGGGGGGVWIFVFSGTMHNRCETFCELKVMRNTWLPFNHLNCTVPLERFGINLYFFLSKCHWKKVVCKFKFA